MSLCPWKTQNTHVPNVNWLNYRKEKVKDLEATLTTQKLNLQNEKLQTKQEGYIQIEHNEQQTTSNRNDPIYEALEEDRWKHVTH